RLLVPPFKQETVIVHVTGTFSFNGTCHLHEAEPPVAVLETLDRFFTLFPPDRPPTPGVHRAPSTVLTASVARSPGCTASPAFRSSMTSELTVTAICARTAGASQSSPMGSTPRAKRILMERLLELSYLVQTGPRGAYRPAAERAFTGQ